MKLPKQVQIKETTSLFANKYGYKVVLICGVAGIFRNKRYDYAETKLKEYEEILNQVPGRPLMYWKPRSHAELAYTRDLYELLQTFDHDDYTLRIEQPRFNFYTNNESYVEQLAALHCADYNPVKFISIPNGDLPELEPGTEIVKTLDYDYKVYIGSFHRKTFESFVEWTDGNTNLRLTNRAKEDLTRGFSFGGSYFYVKGDKTLTMVKMFLGTEIVKINRIVNPQ